MSDDKIIVQGDPDLEGLIPRFLENRRNDVKTVKAATASGDFERVRIIGHSMKGAGGGYGFDTITELGAQIEQGAMANDSVVIESAIKGLADYLTRVEVVFD